MVLDIVTLENGKQAPIIDAEKTLLKYGVCRVRVPFTPEENHHWSQQYQTLLHNKDGMFMRFVHNTCPNQTLSQVTPLNMTSEDGEYAFYRNIIDEPDFPFDRLLDSPKSEIVSTIQTYFLAEEEKKDRNSASNILRIDDAFCINYNMSQDDTRCSKHTDPSDITVNMCLECSNDIQGSQVLFYGTQQLKGVEAESDDKVGDENFVFLVRPKPGYATIHWGHHPHQTLPLTRGERTNIVVTFCYKDRSKSTALSRTCYATDGS